MGTDDRQAVGATEQLARFVTDTRYEDLPEDVDRLLRLMILDTMGVTIAASVADSSDRVKTAIGHYRQVAPIEGAGVSVIGTNMTTDPALASLLNGINAHLDDFDDVHETMIGHPSAPVAAAVLPVAESRGASGREFLRAFAVGVETEARLGDALNPSHYERGWHPTSTIGVLGATIGVGALLDLSVDALRRAVGVACSQAGGIKANFGTTIKPYHVGRAARCGVEAAHMAAAGVSASRDALEREFGGYVDLFGDGGVAADLISFTSGTWRIADPAVAFKPYPCCRSTHAPIDAALAIHESWDDERRSVEQIDVIEHSQRIPHTDRPAPQSPTEAKFSVQYCTSLALTRGEVWLNDFTSDAVADPDRRAYLDDVVVRQDDTLPDWGAIVRVLLADGTTFERSVDAPRGSATRPMSDTEIERKFRRCADPILPAETTDRAIELVHSIETLEDIGTLVGSLAPPTR